MNINKNNDNLTLVIAEKPSVARSIAEALQVTEKKKGYIQGNEYIISWCVGHLIGLAEPEAYDEIYSKWSTDCLPILPDVWKFKIIKETKEQYNILKTLMNDPSVNEIICATDAGREGECIFRYVYKLSGCKKPVKRLWISSVEDSAIKDGFNNLQDDSKYDSLYESGFARAKADWLVGMNGTRLFSSVYKTFLSVGRVQTPTLAMIVNRENEIQDFKKEKYFTLELNLVEFTVCSDRITDYNTAQNIKQKIAGKAAFIKTINKENKIINPPELYDLTALQKEANRLFGYTAQQTLNYAQSLYEKALITYPRTDSRYITADMKEKAEKLINLVCESIPIAKGINYTPDIDKIINDSKVSDHHALLPTVNIADSEFMETIPDAEIKLLNLICAKLIFATSIVHKYEATKVIVDCADMQFTANGKVITELGWKKYEQQLISQITGKDLPVKEHVLPDIAEGLVYENVSSEIKDHWTAPPKRYTEASLLAAMETAGNSDYEDNETEKKGIGSPATRAGIIETLLKRGFMDRTGKNLMPMQKGISLIQAVPEEIRSPKLTSDWEMKLQNIEKGHYSSEEFMNEIQNFIQSIVNTYKNEEVKKDLFFKSERQIMGKCPKCGKKVLEYPKSYSCESGKDGCGFVIWKIVSGKNLPEGAILSLLKNGSTSKLSGFKKKDGSGTFSAYLILKDDFTLGFKFK